MQVQITSSLGKIRSGVTSLCPTDDYAWLQEICASETLVFALHNSLCRNPSQHSVRKGSSHCQRGINSIINTSFS